MAAPPAPARRFLLVLLLLATALLGLIVAPFAAALFTAAVFATVLFPWQRGLTRRFGDRPRLAATVLVLGVTLVVLLPLGYLSFVVSKRLVGAVQDSIEIVRTEGTAGLVQRLPEGLQPLGRRLAEAMPDRVLPPIEPPAAAPEREGAGADGGGARETTPAPAEGERERQPAGRQPPQQNQLQVGPVLTRAAEIAQSLLGSVLAFAIDLGILLVALFFLLVSGRALVQWVVATVPLPDRQMRQFVDEFHDVTVAVFVSTISTAAIQAAVAAIGYLIVGIPLFSVALLATFLAGFVPAIGGGSVTVAVGALVLASGDTGWGIFLIAWGLIAVGLADNLAKPLLAQRRLQLPGAVIFFAMLGGIAVFGPMGVIAGPLIVSLFLVVLRAMGYAAGEAGRADATAATG